MKGYLIYKEMLRVIEFYVTISAHISTLKHLFSYFHF